MDNLNEAAEKTAEKLSQNRNCSSCGSSADTSLLFFFLILVSIFNKYDCEVCSDTLLFFFLLLVILYKKF